MRGMQNGQASNLPRPFARSHAKESAKGWRSNVPCCNARSDNAWMHTTPRQLAAAYSIPCGAALGARVALPATLELLARSNWGRFATASSRENASADTLRKSST